MQGFASLSRLALLLVTLAVGVCLPGFAGGTAYAQGFFGGLFGQPQPQPQAVPFPGQGQYPAPHRYHYRYRTATPRHRSRPAEPKPVTATADKPPAVAASHFVVVIGDSLGQLLANGLDDALRDRPDIAVLHKARDSSGLVREDFYDWPKAVAEMVDKAAASRKTAESAMGKNKQAPDGAPSLSTNEDRIDVAVMMVGSNDRQSISEDGKTFSPGSAEWTTAYTRRVTAIAEAFKSKNIPLIWVGVPITRDDDFADAMAGLNEIYRDVAAKTGTTYVDTWAAFSDDDGDFSTYGPDINGQTVKLRSADGIHFTKAGARKLAHFVEVPIRRAFDRQTPEPPALATAAPEMPQSGKPGAKETEKPKTPAKPDAGPVVVLTQAPKAENGELATPMFRPDRQHADAASVAEGEPSLPRPGRADDASWPHK